MIKYITIFFTVVTFFGCSKEYSFENPLVGGAAVTVGIDCVPTKVIDFDTISNKNINAKQALWHPTGNYPIAIVEIDSFTLQPILSKTLSLSGDTLRVDATQYFLLDLTNNYRVREFVGQSNAYNPNSQRFRYSFIYSTNNRLVSKLVYNPNQGGAIFTQTDYAYSADSSNVIGVKSKIPLNNVVFYDATISYDNAHRPTNFLYMFTDAEELRPYLQLLNFGKRPLNQPNKVVTKNFDPLTSSLIGTNTTDFKNYNYSGDNYVLSTDVLGYNIPALNLENSRNKFQYYCK